MHNLLNKYLNVIISYCIIINPIADTQVAMACACAYVTLRKQIHYVYYFKGQLTSKENCQAVNSSKKRTNEFVFTTM